MYIVVVVAATGGIERDADLLGVDEQSARDRKRQTLCFGVQISPSE